MARKSRLAQDESPELRIARSDGSYVYDARGKKYVDFLMGWCVGNFGWGNAVMERPAARYKGPDYVYPHFDYPPWEELARLLVSVAPEGIEKCFRATGGSEAVDLALQAAMVHTRRTRFLSFEGSYHGNTIAGLSVGASDTREKVPGLLPGCAKVKPPLDERTLARIERAMRKRDVAAFILEPIAMNLGVLCPPEGALEELGRMCRRHGTLLVFDEVATGFGRTGTLLATDQFDARPDMVTLAKAITDGVGGLGALLATGPVARSMEKKGSFYSTYGWHPRSTDIAIATLRYITRNEKRLLSGVARMGEYFRMRLSAMALAREARVRARGLAIAIDFGDEKRVARLAKKCREEGLLVSPEGGNLLLLPALNVDMPTARKGLDILERCLTSAPPGRRPRPS